MNDRGVILTDRSRILMDQTCQRLRAYGYEWESVGLDLEGSAAARDIGSCCHEGIAAMIQTRDAVNTLACGLAASKEAPEYAALAESDQDVVTALVRTWHAVVLPQLQGGWEVVEVEREETFDWTVTEACPPQAPLRRTVRLMSRLDLLARAGEGATLNGLPVALGLYMWDWKCMGRADERWRKAQQYDMQWTSQLLGTEARIGERLAGVIVVALVKNDHPLVWCWRSAKATLSVRAPTAGRPASR